jgi:hypothetical protein
MLATGTEQGSKPFVVDHGIDIVLADMLKRSKTAGNGSVPEDLQIAAVRRFWESKSVQSFRDAYQLSWALCVPHKVGGPCILEDRQRLQTVLQSVTSWGERPVAFRRCYQGLMQSYFTYDAPNAITVGRQNWAQLREYLQLNCKAVVDSRVNPDWVTTLVGNRQLFTDSPFEPYVAALLRGDNSSIDHLCKQLGIVHTSWFLRELILAQVQGATKLANAQFVELMPRLLTLLKGNGVLRDRGTVLVLDRYAKVPGLQLHHDLCESVVSWWGNPWLPSNETRWGGVTDTAKAMVTEWLKLEFIETFFTKLAEDGLGDRRRMDFWKRYVKFIKQIQFALGSFARTSREPDFVALRKKMAGLLCELDASGTNNAFIMTMGNLKVVEFSGMGNALYGYDVQKQIPFNTSQPLRLTVDARNSLKHKRERILWLSHQDGIRGWDEWEQMFEATLKENFGIVPGAAAATVARAPAAPSTQSQNVASTDSYSLDALTRFSNDHGLSIENRNSQGGCIWVCTDADNPTVNKTLIRWGFKFKGNKGWWK